MTHQSIDRQPTGAVELDEPRQELLHNTLALDASAHHPALLKCPHLDGKFNALPGASDEAARAPRRERVYRANAAVLQDVLSKWSTYFGGELAGET